MERLDWGRSWWLSRSAPQKAELCWAAQVQQHHCAYGAQQWKEPCLPDPCTG